MIFKVLLTNKSKSGYKCIQCAELSLIKMFRGIKSEILTSIVEKNRFLANTYFELRIRPVSGRVTSHREHTLCKDGRDQNKPCKLQTSES